MSERMIRLAKAMGIRLLLGWALIGGAFQGKAQSKTTEEVEQIAKLEILLKELQQGYAIVH
jgi:hypothetical protein